MVIEMNYINFSKEVPQAECLVTVGKTGYWCDSYVILGDGILLANKKLDDPEKIILTRIDHTGLILTEFSSETTWAEFEELRNELEEEMGEYVPGESSGCQCGDGDEDSGEAVEDPNFKTAMTNQDVMSYA